MYLPYIRSSVSFSQIDCRGTRSNQYPSSRAGRHHTIVLSCSSPHVRKRDTAVITDKLFPENPLHLYGTALETYQGTGYLTLSSERRVTCQFVAGQLSNGKTVILCATNDFIFDLMLGLATPTHFEGATYEGDRVEVDHVVSETNYLSEATHQGTYLALRVGHLKVVRRMPYSRRRLRFILTNLSGIHSSITFSCGSLSFTLRPLEDAPRNLERLQVSRDVLPTAQLEVATRASLERVTKAVSEICYLLSLALGTKIQWVALTESSNAGSWLCRHHYSHVTKRYGVLCALDPRSTDIGAFLQQCGDGRFTRSREQAGLTNATIDTYLDAKSEGDFLQVRALKLVVAVEMLKAEFVERSGARPLVFSDEEFDALVPELKRALRGVIVNSTADQRKDVYANVLGLNRIPFSSQLRELCAAVRMAGPDEEVRRFVASRNKLVHEGHFYCERATEREKARLPPLLTVQLEWFWLLHFVDRLFLRAIGYEGTYLDWSIPSSPIPRQLGPVA